MALPALLAVALLAAHHQEGPAPPRAKHPARVDPARFLTNRKSPIELPLPDEKDAFAFVVFGDRTGGPPEGVKVLAEAVADVNLLEPDLVMTVGDLVQGYNERPEWLVQMREFKGIMDRLMCPWFPVAGNHDIYWRGKGERPRGEHEADYEEHFGPLWYAFRHKRAWFVVLYSDEGDPATGAKSFEDPAAQRMSPEQLAWLEATLGKARGAEHVFLFLHHPRWLRGGYGDDWERVHALLASAKNVTAVFAGHIHHMRYDGARDGIEYFALATVGGVQDGFAAEAGYLHQYHVVTVRESGIAVAAFPVGAALDPRAITGEVSDDVKALAQTLVPRWDGDLVFGGDEAVDGACTLELFNPTHRPVEFTVATQSGDARWRLTPDHAHVVVEPAATERVALRAQRPARALDAAFRFAEVTVDAEYLAEGLRVPLPRRTWSLPLDPSSLPVADAGTDGWLELDGKRDCLVVDSRRLALPDGPFTLEGWLYARELRGRQGFLCKTESSEFGILLDDGTPEFLVHLGGRYATARAKEAPLTKDAWHHVAGVYDGSEVRLYVDGALVHSLAAAGARRKNELPLIVGADVGQGGAPNSFLAGRIDEVRISRCARYQGQRFEPSRRFEPDGDTLLLQHMDGEIGPWMPDASGRGVHAVRGR